VRPVVSGAARAASPDAAPSPRATAPIADPGAAPSGPLPLTPEEWWSRAIGLSRESIACVPRAPVRRWSGDATLRFRGRYSEDDADNDLYQYLRLRYRREDAPGWSASMHLRISEDLDGQNDGSSFFVFDSVDDTYDSPVLSRLYHLYASYRPPSGVVEQVRVGRQDVTAGDLFHVDGAHVLLRPGPAPTRLYAFGGVPSHLYEASVEGDWIVGAGAAFDPWCGASVEVSDVFLEDESGLYGARNANLATVQLSQRLRTWGSLRAGYQQLDDEPRVAWASADLLAPRLDATVRGAVRTQILSEKAQAYDIDPYYAILLEYEPYWEASLSASKGLGRVWAVEAGGQVRRLYDEDDRGDFNHEFTRAYATVSAKDWPARGLGVAVTGEGWRAEDGEDIGAVGFEVEWKPGGCWRATAGMDYALYRTDLYAAEERYDSYGWFLRARWRSSRWEWDGSLRLDTDDFDTYVTANLSLRFEF
jgi:hypothetical protein